MKFGLPENIVLQIQNVFEGNSKIDEVFVFGSRAKGNYREGSDIDLAVKGRNVSYTDILTLSTQLDELNLPYEIDLLDYAAIKDEDVVEHIDRMGIVFFKQWKKVVLQNVVTKLGDGLHGTPKYDENGEYYFINGNNLIDGKIVIKQSTQKVSFEEYLKYKKDLNERTILLGINGTIGNVALYKNEKCILGKSVCYFNIIDSIDRDFVKYVINDITFQSYIENFANGTTIKNVALKTIREFAFLLPPIKEQTSIASILSSLDDKIDLLQRQNKTLEQLAETLFRQWFVEEASEEWEETTLYDAIILIGGGTPKTNVPEYWDGKIKWLSGGDIAENHKSFIMTTEKTISDKGLNNSSSKLLPKYATVISARGTVGKYCLLSEPMAFSQSNYGIKPKYEDCYFYTYLLIAYSVDELQSSAYGSVFDTITTKTFQEQLLILPEYQTIKQFEREITPYFQKMLNNQNQIQTLTQLRDQMLPKLMTGEVRVK